MEEKNLQVFCVVTGHKGDPCQENTWPARYRVNKYITSKVSILSTQNSDDETNTLGFPIYVMSDEEDMENTVQAIGQDGEWISVISPEIEAKEAWARQRDGEAQPLVRLGEDLPPWPRTHLCKINRAPCKLFETKEESDTVKQIQAWESVLALELDPDNVHIRIGGDKDMWARLDDFVGLPLPPGVCRPNEELTFCEEDKNCEEQCVLGGKCKKKDDVTCGKDSDCSVHGPCVMGGKCDSDQDRLCRSDEDCGNEDSCREFAGRCQGQDAICSSDAHCGDDIMCIMGGVCSGGVAGELPKKCTSNADCEDPSMCQSGGHCTLDSSLNCALDEDCSKTDAGKCKSGGSCSNDPAKLCLTDAECENGGVCRTGGTCAKDDSMSCTIDADCENGNGPCVSGGKCSEGQKDECTNHVDCEGQGVCLKGGHCDVSTDVTCNGEDGQCPEGETCKAPGGCKKDMKMSCKTDKDCGESGPCVEATSSPVEGESDDDDDEDDGDKNKDDEDSGKEGNDDEKETKEDDENEKDDTDGNNNESKDDKKNEDDKKGAAPDVPAAAKKGGLEDLMNGKKKGGLGAALFMNLVAAAQASMGRRRRFRESDVNLRAFQPNMPDANANPLQFKKSFVEESRKSEPSASSSAMKKTRLKVPKQSISGSDVSSSLFSSSLTMPSSVSAMSNPLYSTVGGKRILDGRSASGGLKGLTKQE